MRAHGHVFKYGDNVDTDVIIPARYLNSFDAVWARFSGAATPSGSRACSFRPET